MRPAMLLPALLATGIVLFSSATPAFAKGGGPATVSQAKQGPQRASAAASRARRSGRALAVRGAAPLSPMLVLDPFSSTASVVVPRRGDGPVTPAKAPLAPPRGALHRR